MNLENEIKEAIRKEIIKFFDDQKIIIPEEKRDYTSVMLFLFNINRKWIPKKPRKVVISAALKEKLNGHLERTICDYEKCLEKEFEVGENINSHLSRNIYQASRYDKLLDQWGIHHLHLNPERVDEESEMKKNRSDKYLLFLVEKDFVYFLDIVDHLHGEEFANRGFIQIIRDNGWDHLSLIKNVPYIEKLQHNVIDKKDIYDSWKSNVNLIIANGDKNFFIGNGTSLSGDSLCDIELLTNFNRCLFKLSQERDVSISKIFIMNGENILFLEVNIGNKTCECKIKNSSGANHCAL